MSQIKKNKKFGQRVRAARLVAPLTEAERQARAVGGRPLTQAELGLRLRTASPNVTAIETGNKSPGPKMVARLAAALGVDVETLVTGR